MMMIAPNSLVRQKQGAQGEEEEEPVGRRKAWSIGTIDPTRSGQECRMVGTKENMDCCVGF